MRNRWKLVAAGLLLCGGLTCLLIGERDGEPRYRGRSLSQWVQRHGDPHAEEEARDALKKLKLMALDDPDLEPRWRQIGGLDK